MEQENQQAADSLDTSEASTPGSVAPEAEQSDLQTPEEHAAPAELPEGEPAGADTPDDQPETTDADPVEEPTPVSVSEPDAPETAYVPAPAEEPTQPDATEEEAPESSIVEEATEPEEEPSDSPEFQSSDESASPDADEASTEHDTVAPLTQEALIRQLLTAPVTTADTTIVQQIDTRALEEAQLNISHQVFDLSERVSTLVSANSAIITDLHKVAEENEQLVHWSQHVQVTSALSKVFQVVSICILVALLGGISWLAVLQNQTQARLNTAEATLAEALKLQQKRLADYDKHFAELVGKELQTELETTHKTTLQEQLNKLRGGNAEQRIYRRNSGDWFVVSGKSEQHVVDPDIIEALNQAFVRSGKQLVTRSPMPPHKVWGLLKSNGHGGTDIVVTSEVTP